MSVAGFPPVIVVGDERLHDTLTRAGVHWATQSVVLSVADMWRGLQSGELSTGSVAVVISDTVPDREQLLPAVETLAPHAPVFILMENPHVQPWLEKHFRLKLPTGMPGGVHYVPLTTGGDVLQNLRQELSHVVAFPAQFPPEVTAVDLLGRRVETSEQQPSPLFGAEETPVSVPSAEEVMSTDHSGHNFLSPSSPEVLTPENVTEDTSVERVNDTITYTHDSSHNITEDAADGSDIDGNQDEMSEVNDGADGSAVDTHQGGAVDVNDELVVHAVVTATSDTVAADEVTVDENAADEVTVDEVATDTVTVDEDAHDETAIDTVTVDEVTADEILGDGHGVPEVVSVDAHHTETVSALVNDGMSAATGNVLPLTPELAEGPPPLQSHAAAGSALGTVITCTSSKGGSGKSTSSMMLAATVAHASAAAGQPLKVVLVDLDTRDGQIASLIGQYQPTALSLRYAPAVTEQTVLANLQHDTNLGIDCLLAPVRPRTADDCGPEFYRQVIQVLRATHDVVILDTSVNYLDPLIAEVALPEADTVLMCTTMATTALHGLARALREMLEQPDRGGMGVPKDKIGIVVNQAVKNVDMTTEQVIQSALGARIVGAIPMASRDVLIATNRNQMYKLLQHPHLAPAFFQLAKTTLPAAALTPATPQMGSERTSSSQSAATPTADNAVHVTMHPAAPRSAATAAPTTAPAATGTPAPAKREPTKKRSLFRR